MFEYILVLSYNLLVFLLLLLLLIKRTSNSKSGELNLIIFSIWFCYKRVFVKFLELTSVRKGYTLYIKYRVVQIRVCNRVCSCCCCWESRLILVNMEVLHWRVCSLNRLPNEMVLLYSLSIPINSKLLLTNPFFTKHEKVL